MRQFRRLVVAFAYAAGFVGTSAAREGEEFDLKAKTPKQNQAIERTSTFTIVDAKGTVTAAGATDEFKQSLTVEYAEKVKYGVVKGGQVIEAVTTVVKQNVTTVTNMKEVASDGALLGAVITSKRLAKGKWKHEVKGGASEKQKQELALRVGPENDDKLYPQEKVIEGHEWEVDAADLGHLFGGSITELKGTLSFKLDRIEDRKGDSCAVIVSSGTVTGVTKGDGGGLKVVLKLEGTTFRSLATGIDVQDDATGTIRMSGKVKSDGLEFELDLKGEFTLTGTAKMQP